MQEWPVRNIYLFVGPPGSGKGSLSQLCADKLGYIQLSVGNLCRKHIINGTAVGKEIEQAINMGQLAPDKLIVAMVLEWLGQQEAVSSLILDGFPRTMAQAELFEKMINENKQIGLLHVIRFVVSDDHLVKRLQARLVCSYTSCQAVYSMQDQAIGAKDGITCDRCGKSLIRRVDDEFHTIFERLAVYRHHENDLLGFYHKKGKTVIELNAELPLAAVFENFSRQIVKEKSSYLMGHLA